MRLLNNDVRPHCYGQGLIAIATMAWIFRIPTADGACWGEHV